MGKSVADIRALTGFGETTIRARLKIAKLDGGKVRAGLERGATLSDLVELDGIKNPDLKSKTLEKAGTPDFKNALKSALQREKRDALMKRWRTEAGAFAEEIRTVDHATMKFYASYGVFDKSAENAKVLVPYDAATGRKYYYVADTNYLYLYREVTAADRRREDAEAASAKEARRTADLLREARETELKEITARHFHLRKSFVAECPCGGKSDAEAVTRYAASTLAAVNYGQRYECDLQLLAELLDMESALDFENMSREDVRKELLRAESYGKPCSAARLLLCAAYSMNDREENGYLFRGWNAKAGRNVITHWTNPGLDRLYELLIELGYEMSTEERAMRDGTHELFKPSAREAEAAAES